MRGLDLQPLTAGAAAVLLIASMGWWLFSTPELIDPGQPTWKGADIVRMKAAVPEISPFEHFYVNHDNPFVPHNLRVAETGTYDPRTRPVAQTPPRPVPIPPPKAPVIVSEPEKPKLVLPKLTRAPTNAPIAYGLLVSDGEEVVIVRMPGVNAPVNLKPGDKIAEPGNKNAEWTLLSIDSGNLATFLDPNGIEHRFAIGQGDLAVAQSGSDAAAPGKDAAGDKTNGGRGMVPKAPGPGAPGTRPPGVDGPIPRPPPREERRRREPMPDGQGKAVPPQPVPKK
jgi:hypothetical protein